MRAALHRAVRAPRCAPHPLPAVSRTLELGADSVVAIGQGANDAGMLKAAALGICVMSAEGAAGDTLLAADIVVPDIATAFDLLDKPKRIIASLRK